MEPEQSPTPNNDSDSIRRDAATPLHYRGAVRALLGMPDAEGETPTFARMVPAAGFQYHLQPPTGAASRISHPLENTDPAAFDDAQAHELQSFEGLLGGAAPDHWSVEALRKWLLDVPPQSPPTTAAPRQSTLEQPPGAQPDAADSYPTPAVDTRPSDHRGLAPRPTQHQSPPTTVAPRPSTLAQPPEAQPDAADRYPNPAVDTRASHHRGLSQPTAQHQGTGAASERDRESVAATATAAPSGDVLEHTTIAVPGISERSQYFPALAPEKPGDRPALMATEPSPRQVPPADPRLQTAESLAFTGRAQSSLTEVTRKVQAHAHQHEATLPLDLLPWRVPSPTMQEGEAGSIEHLQRVVRELAAQVASWQTRTAHENQRQQTEQQPPRRAERVVIIKQAAQRSGPPPAFWERSYLGHLSWRTMR